MDADIMQVYKRLAEKRNQYYWYSKEFQDTMKALFPSDLCTAEMTTYPNLYELEGRN